MEDEQERTVAVLPVDGSRTRGATDRASRRETRPVMVRRFGFLAERDHEPMEGRALSTTPGAVTRAVAEGVVARSPMRSPDG